MMSLMNVVIRFMLSHLEDADDTPLSAVWAAIQALGALLLSLLSLWFIASLAFYDAPFPYDLAPFWP